MTSNAEVQRPRARAARRRHAADAEHLVAVALLDLDVVARRASPGRASTPARRRRTGCPARAAASASGYVPILLATSPLAAMRSAPTTTASARPAGDHRRPGAVDDDLVVDAELGRARTPSAASPAAAAGSRRRSPTRRCPARAARARCRARCPTRRTPARRCCSGCARAGDRAAQLLEQVGAAVRRGPGSSRTSSSHDRRRPRRRRRRRPRRAGRRPGARPTTG